MEQQTTYDEVVLNVIIGFVIIVGVLMIMITFTVLKRWYNIYKIEKYVQEEQERKQAEEAQKAGHINARGKW